MSHTAYVDAVFFSTDGKTLISVGTDDLKFWDVAAKKERESSAFPNAFSRLWCVSPDRKTIAWLHSDEIKLFNVDLKKVIKTFKGHFNVVSLAFSPDGNNLASGGGDGNIYLWSIKLKRDPEIIKAHSSTIGALIFTPDGSRLISGSLDKTIKIWNVS